MELRCDAKILHGITEGDTVEVTCKSKWCGKRPGVVVLHTFNIRTGELLTTRKFAEPREEGTDDSCSQGAAVRSA